MFARTRNRLPGYKVFQAFVVVIAVALLSACISHGRPTNLPAPPDSGPAEKKELTIALLGATGLVGSFFLQEALAEGYDIRALARTPQKLDALKDQIIIIEGDARDRSAIEALLRGSDIVVSALGPVKADGDAAKMISSTASEHIITLAPQYDITRYIVISGAAVTMPGDAPSATGWVVKKMASIALRDTLIDKQAEYQLLEESSMHWTLIRCPLIKPKPFEREPEVSNETVASFSLRAGELARFMIEQLQSQQYIRKGPFLSSH